MINFDNVAMNRENSNPPPRTTHEFYKPEKFKKDKEVQLPVVKHKKKEVNTTGEANEKPEDREPKM
jgi:hypothetical protein